MNLEASSLMFTIIASRPPRFLLQWHASIGMVCPSSLLRDTCTGRTVPVRRIIRSQWGHRPLLGCPKLACSRLNITSAACRSCSCCSSSWSSTGSSTGSSSMAWSGVIVVLQLDNPIPHPGGVSTVPKFLWHKMECGISPRFSRQEPSTVSQEKRRDEHSQQSMQHAEVHCDHCNS